MPRALLTERHQASSWRSFLFSFTVHLLLIALACWMVLRYATPARLEAPQSMVVAGGASSPALGVKSFSQTKTSTLERAKLQRLTVKNAISGCVVSSVALPKMKPGGSLGTSGQGLGKGGQGHGFASGLGQGLGTASGFTGKPVLGATIRAKKVAVYLDCSGSMKPYLDHVNREIRHQFPDADVFRFDGARVLAYEKVVVYGRGFHGVAPRVHEAPTQTILADLTPYGHQLQERFSQACEKGSLGAWLDYMIQEPYDALVVFSDFQDGVRIYEQDPHRDPRLIYSDSYYHPVNHGRALHYPWEQRWLDRFALGQHFKGPRLYLFTVQQEPQPILLKCVAASGGASTSVSWLKKKPAVEAR